MGLSVREGDRVIVQFENGEIEYIIHRIDGENIYIRSMDGEDLFLIYFNGHNWVIDGREDIKFRFDPPDIIQQIGDPNIMINILTKLSYPDILRMCETSKEINQLCHLDELWRIKLWEDFRFNIPTYKPLRHIYSEIYHTVPTVEGANRDAEDGRLEVLKWLNSLSPPIRPDVLGANGAAWGGHLDVLKWLNDLDPPIRPNDDGAGAAAWVGHLDVLKWLNELDPPIRPDDFGATGAARYGHLEVLKWLNSLDPPILPEPLGAIGAASLGQLHVLEWLRNLDPPIVPRQSNSDREWF